MIFPAYPAGGVYVAFKAPELAPPDPTGLKVPPATLAVQYPVTTPPVTVPLSGTGVFKQNGPYEPGVTTTGLLTTTVEDTVVGPHSLVAVRLNGKGLPVEDGYVILPGFSVLAVVGFGILPAGMVFPGLKFQAYVLGAVP